MSIPFILNMNNYMKSYDDIKNKLDETVDPEYFKAPQKLNNVSF